MLSGSTAPSRLGVFQIDDETIAAALLVGHRIEDLIEFEQRIAGKYICVTSPR